MYDCTWNFSSNCSRNRPLSNIHRDGLRLSLTSQRSVTMRYFMTPESEMRVLTPKLVIIATESRSCIAAAVCSFCSWHDNASKEQKEHTAMTAALRSPRFLLCFILSVFTFRGNRSVRFSWQRVGFLPFGADGVTPSSTLRTTSR